MILLRYFTNIFMIIDKVNLDIKANVTIFFIFGIDEKSLDPKHQEREECSSINVSNKKSMYLLHM